LSFGGLHIGRLQQTKGEGRLIGFMNEPRRYQTFTITQLDLNLGMSYSVIGGLVAFSEQVMDAV